MSLKVFEQVLDFEFSILCLVIYLFIFIALGQFVSASVSQSQSQSQSQSSIFKLHVNLKQQIPTQRLMPCRNSTAIIAAAATPLSTSPPKAAFPPQRQAL